MGIKISSFDAFSKAVDKYIQPATAPIAVKMLKSEKEIPKKARRPLRDYGIKLLPCQALYLSRKHGIPVALMNEDFEVILCPVGSIAFGMRPPVKWWRQGNAAHKGYAKTLKAKVKPLPESHSPADKLKALEFGYSTDPLYTGVFYEIDKPTLEDNLQSQIDARGTREEEDELEIIKKLLYGYT